MVMQLWVIIFISLYNQKTVNYPGDMDFKIFIAKSILDKIQTKLKSQNGR
jgi:hypothetical protein